LLGVQEVPGSNPGGPTNQINTYLQLFCVREQLDGHGSEAAVHP